MAKVRSEERHTAQQRVRAAQAEAQQLRRKLDDLTTRLAKPSLL